MDIWRDTNQENSGMEALLVGKLVQRLQDGPLGRGYAKGPIPGIWGIGRIRIEVGIVHGFASPVAEQLPPPELKLGVDR